MKVRENSSCLIVSRSFRDVDELNQLLNNYREVQVEPLSLEPFQGNFYQVDFDALTLIFAEVLTPVNLRGARRSDYTQFGVFLQLGANPALVHQQSVDIDTLCGFDSSRGSDNIYPQNTLIGEIQVRQDLLESTLIFMHRDDLDARFFQRELIYLPTTLSTYRSYLQQLFHLIKQRSPLLYRSDYRRLIIEDLLPLLIDTIPRMKSSAKKNLLPKKKIKPALKAREYILNNLQQPLTLKKLYQAIGSSRRNLYYSFEATFGMTPMHYVKAMRLQGLRRELKAAEPEKTLVMNIASRWGFWSAGHLARDYKKMFGELPSETLDKNWQ